LLEKKEKIGADAEKRPGEEPGRRIREKNLGKKSGEGSGRSVKP